VSVGLGAAHGFGKSRLHFSAEYAEDYTT